MPELRPRHLSGGRGGPVAAFAVAAALVLAPLRLSADTLVLRDGDRISGKITAKGTRRIRLQTPYGLLAVPRDRIEKIVHEDGSEEVLDAPAAVSTASPSPRPALRLVLIVTGASFWQAWDPKGGAPLDPSLRLEVRLDERIVGRYLDPVLDPQDLPGAVVNSFSFAPDSLKLVPGPLVELAPPETQPGRIRLEIRLPSDQAGAHALHVTYQVNDATDSEPGWRDLVGAVADIRLQPGAPTLVELQQDRGRMEFSKRRMKNVETFRLAAVPE